MAGSALQAALRIEASRDREPDEAHPQETALERITATGLAQSLFIS
jgi:hypothetical protein